MKKIHILLVFIIIVIISSLFVLGCKKNNVLEAPGNIHVDSDDFLRWNEVKNADSYLVVIDGEEYITENNELDLLDKCTQLKEYSVTLRAVCNGSSSETAYFNFELSLNKALGYKLTDDQSGISMKVVFKEKLPSKVVIPSEINGKPVVGLDQSAFLNCDNLTSIYIPDSVTKISSGCFSGCKNLERVRLPSDLKELNHRTFYNCSKLKNIELPTSINKMGFFVFYGCKSLEKIELPMSLTALYLDSFTGCDNLKKIEISKYIKHLGSAGIDIEVFVDEQNPYYYVLNNCILDKSNNEIVAAGKLSVIPEVATGIKSCAFSGSKISHILIPKNIKTIGVSALFGTGLEEIVIEDGVEEICQNAFRTCHYLKRITIPASVTKIEDGTIISDCSALEEIIVASENKTYYVVDGYILTKANNTIITGTLKKPIPAVAEEIAEYAFIDNTQENIFIPVNIKKVGDYAFYPCRNIKTAVFYSERIGAKIFGYFESFGCFNMTSIRISKDVKYIEEGAFYICHNVNSITLPDDVVLGGNLIYSPVTYTIYYPESVSFSLMSNGRFGCVQSDIDYDGDFPYVKSIKPVYITTEYGGRETTQLEYSSDFLAPAREGYTFEGWSKNEDCSTLDYPVYIREAFRYEMFTEKHYYLESRLTHNPFAEKQNLKPNEYYDPEVKILYAVWRKN